MRTLTLHMEDDLMSKLEQLKGSPESAARELIVLELYRRHVISGGKASELLGMGRFEFIEYSGRLGIPYFDMTPEELDQDLETLRRLCPRPRQ